MSGNGYRPGDIVHVPQGKTAHGITNFEHWDLIPIKRMVENSRPDRMDEVADHWMNVKKELDAAADELKAATDHITQHWEGSAAEGFAKRSSELQQSITNTGLHAQNTSHALKYAGESLRTAKTEMAAIHVPSKLESAEDYAGDWGDRSDTQFRSDIASGMDRDQAIAKNKGSLSLMEERHQQAIAVMERLAPKYTAASATMVPPEGDPHDRRGGVVPSPPDKTIQRPDDVGPTPTGPGQGGGSGGGTTRSGSHSSVRDPGQTGINGGSSDPGDSTHGTGGGAGGGGAGNGTGYNPVHSDPPAKTGIDGTGGAPGGTGDVPGGGFGSGSGGHSGAGLGEGGSPGGLGTGGGGGGAVIGAGRMAGFASEEGRAAGLYGGGRSGIGGGLGRMSETAEGLGGRAGGLTKRSGAVIGEAEGRAGESFTEGGTGLGRNRAGAGANGRSGMAEMGGGAGTRKKDKKKGGSRPDYLVEDEDTWATGEHVNPPVVE